jgi:ubiquinone/menaquinone biosynthesis C-methylase UbiE
LGRFVKIVHENFNFDISAVEINKDSAEIVNNMGIKTYNINFLDNQFEDNQFDIVHCSHVIEHIPYPGIIKFLDELIRITKPNGYIIIRSPLISIEFYTSIDHIRPYPPKAILDYYSNPQQQVVGKYSITPVKIRLRRGAVLVNGYSYNPIVRGINMFFKLSWACIRFPFSKPNGYVAIFKKN